MTEERMQWNALGFTANDHERSVRTFSCGDGVHRAVWLRNYYWRALDWLACDRGYDMTAMTRRCSAYTNNAESADYEFAAWLEHSISYYVDLCRQSDMGFANDDFVSPFFASALR